MAVYRSDQAILTFAPEAGHGGYPELASGVTDASGSKVARLTADTPAGTRTLAVDNMTTPPVDGDYIQIGPEMNTDSTTTRESEVRRVEYVDGTTGLTLDAPTAFFHADNTDLTAVDAVSSNNKEKLITWLPGVYETVEVPDPEMAIEGRYLLGTNQKRNFFVAYKGQQTFNGSLGGFVLLNGWPLRFPVGMVTSISSGGRTNKTYLAGTTNAVVARKGDIYIDVASASALSAGNVIAIDHADSPNSSSVCEIRRIAEKSTNNLRLNYPLQFDHKAAGSGSTQIRAIDPTTSGIYYQHDIFETVDLDTISWNVHMRDSAEAGANDFNRRYFGGHVGSMTLAAEEGGLLTTSWDGINFQDMVHDQKFHDSFGSGSTALPGYALMQSINKDDLGVPQGDLDDSSATYDPSGFPTTDPYYFSQGSFTMFGVEFARLRSFSISITNNEEPRYYIGGQGKGTRRHRGPSEIREQQREYSMSASIVLPDSVDGENADTGTGRRLFTELLLEGDYGTTTSSMAGFAVTLTFTRGANATITITIPDDGTAAAGGGQQGAFIRSAPHAVSGDNPLQVDADILFRNMKIQIKDTEPFYP